MSIYRSSHAAGSDHSRDLSSVRLQEAGARDCQKCVRYSLRSSPFTGHLVVVPAARKSRRLGPKMPGSDYGRRPAPDPPESSVYNTGVSDVLGACASRH